MTIQWKLIANFVLLRNMRLAGIRARIVFGDDIMRRATILRGLRQQFWDWYKSRLKRREKELEACFPA